MLHICKSNGTQENVQKRKSSSTIILQTNTIQLYIQYAIYYATAPQNMGFQCTREPEFVQVAVFISEMNSKSLTFVPY